MWLENRVLYRVVCWCFKYPAGPTLLTLFLRCNPHLWGYSVTGDLHCLLSAPFSQPTQPSSLWQLSVYSLNLSLFLWYLSFSVWLTSLSVTPSRSSHAIAKGKISFVSWPSSIPLCQCTRALLLYGRAVLWLVSVWVATCWTFWVLALGVALWLNFRHWNMSESDVCHLKSWP